jgi:hypothetical protein
MTTKLHDPDFYHLMSDSELTQEDYDVISAGIDGLISADEANSRHALIYDIQSRNAMRKNIIELHKALKQWDDHIQTDLKALRAGRAALVAADAEGGDER